VLTLDEFHDLKRDQEKFLMVPFVTIEPEVIYEVYDDLREARDGYILCKNLSWLADGSVSFEDKKEKIQDLPDTMISQIIARVTNMVVTGEISDVNVIRLLEQRLNIKLMTILR